MSAETQDVVGFFLRAALAASVCLAPAAAWGQSPPSSKIAPTFDGKWLFADESLSFGGAPVAFTSTYGCDAKGAVHLVIVAPSGGLLMQTETPVNRLDICVPPGTKITAERTWSVP